MIKKLISSIATPLYHIFTKSFECGVIPSQLKIAKVVPIFKSGDKTNPSNYRPISLLPNFSKILEKLMSNRLSSFLENNNLFSPKQFGFRKNHSTVHPLMHFINTLSKANNKKLYTIAIFCDLQKAFDTVDFSILLNKLENLGVRGMELEWFRNYLSNRKQFVSLNNINSSLMEIILGVPQGSVLGPLLFLIYINDIQLHTELETSLFADDTALLKSHSNLSILAENVNKEFQKVVTFFRSHKLALHPEKTKFMIFTNSKIQNFPEIFINFNDINTPNELPPIKMSCINCEESPHFKFLGVFFDPALNFKKHISYISSKLSKSLYFLRAGKHVLNEKSLKMFYYATFHSHLIYANQIWTSTFDSNLKEIIVKQKYAIRIIANCKYNAHTEPIFKKLNILPFPMLTEYFKLQFMQNYVQGFLPSSFNNMWTTNRERRENEAQVMLRNDDEINIPFARTKLICLQPLILLPKLWTEFPDERIKFLRNKIEFNVELKKYFMDKLDINFQCKRLFCPACLGP